MRSKNKPRQTAAESRHVSMVANLDCVVCSSPGPSEVHEIEQGKWWLSCALCADCHRGSFNGLHGQKRIWHTKKISELDALSKTLSQIYGNS